MTKIQNNNAYCHSRNFLVIPAEAGIQYNSYSRYKKLQLKTIKLPSSSLRAPHQLEQYSQWRSKVTCQRSIVNCSFDFCVL